MITDEEMLKRIDDVSTQYKGQIDVLLKSVGMIVLGRKFGWRVIRLVVSTTDWTKANKIFGDLKEYMPERGVLAKKSVGLKMVDALDGYWDVIRGVISVPMSERRKTE